MGRPCPKSAVCNNFFIRKYISCLVYLLYLFCRNVPSLLRARIWNEKPEELLAEIGTKGIYAWLEVTEVPKDELEKHKDALAAEGHS